MMRDERFTRTRIQTGITHDIAKLIRYASRHTNQSMTSFY